MVEDQFPFKKNIIKIKKIILITKSYKYKLKLFKNIEVTLNSEKIKKSKIQYYNYLKKYNLQVTIHFLR